MNKKEYPQPHLTLLVLSGNDVIATSLGGNTIIPGGTTNTGGGIDLPFIPGNGTP